MMIMPPLTDINLRNPKIKAAFINKLEAYRYSKDNTLEGIGYFCVLAAKKLSKWNKKRFRHCWSPQMVAIMVARRSILCIRRHMHGHCNYPVWTRDNYKEGLKKVRRAWRWDLDRLRATGPTPLSENFLYNWDYWTNMTYDDLLFIPDKALRELSNNLSGKEAKAMRSGINENTRKLEENRTAGLLGKVIQPLLGTIREPFSLRSLNNNGVVLTDQYEIYDVIKQYFYEHFKDYRQSDFPPLESDEDLTNWLRFDSLEAYKLAHAHLNIPVSLVEAIWGASRPKVSINEAMNDPWGLMATPTLQEFQQSINHTKSFSSGGMSGLTNNMMKCWPKKMVESVHMMLCDIWNDDHGIPDYWKWKWLVPIPKVPNPAKEDLRPLALIEVLRKVWSGIFVHRIQKFLEFNKLLDSAQHGFRAHKGTDTAIFNMINSLESAKEYRTKIYLGCWDLRKAFDTVPKNTLVWSWIRLGIPLPLAVYLVKMDFGGYTAVRTPLTANVNNNLSYQGLKDQDLVFQTELGCGQGDVPSPTNWNAFFDILLTALSSFGSEFSSMGIYGFSIPQEQVAYADDLNSLMATLEKFQYSADLICAFTSLMGLSLSINKFRAFEINWGNKIHSTDAHIILHTDGWSESRIKMETTGSMKHLGVPWDLALAPSSAWSDATKLLKEACTRLISRKASPESKKLAMELAVFPKVGYFAKYLYGDVKHAQDLDTPVNTFVRNVTKNLNSCPNTILYTSKKRGGLGFKRISNYILRSKFAVWERMMIRDDSEKVIASGIATREARSRGDPVVPGYAIIIDGESNEKWWFSSCIEWLKSYGLRLVLPGEWAMNTAEESLLSFAKNKPDIVIQTIQDNITNGINTVGDYNSVKRAQNDSFDDPFKHVQAVPRIGQFWLYGDVIREIISFNWDVNETFITFRRWYKLKEDDPIAPGTIFILYETRGYPSCTGIDADCKCSTEDFFYLEEESPSVVPTRYQCFLSPDTHTLEGSTARLVAKSVRDVKLDFSPSYDINNVSAYPGSTLYTDGSWMDSSSMGSKLIGRNTFRAGGSLVERTPNGKWIGYYTICSQGEFISAFDMELMMLILAGLMRDNPDDIIRSDCKSAIEVATKGQWGWKSSNNSLLRAAAAKNPLPNILYLEAHPERKLGALNWNSWSIDQQGIYLADLLAGGELKEFWEKTNTEPTELMEDYILDLMVKIAGYGLYKESNIPYLGTISDLIDKTDIESYLISRDKISRHTGPDKENHWKGSSYMLAASLCKSDAGIASQAANMRILWDKQLTGANCEHYKLLEDTSQSLCRFCRESDTLEHRISSCPQPSVAESRDSAMANYSIAISEIANTHDKRTVKALTMYRKILERKGNGLAWLGLWFDDQALEIKHAIDSCKLSASQYNTLHKVLKKLCCNSIATSRNYVEVQTLHWERDIRMKYYNINNMNRKKKAPLLSKIEDANLRMKLLAISNQKKRNGYETFGEDQDVSKKLKSVEHASNPDSNLIYIDVIANDPLKFGVHNVPTFRKRSHDLIDLNNKTKKIKASMCTYIDTADPDSKTPSQDKKRLRDEDLWEIFREKPTKLLKTANRDQKKDSDSRKRKKKKDG